MENAVYLKDSNPTAFNELQKLWAKSGVIHFTLDKLRASYTDCLAEWKCREGHIWLSEVACRENEYNDMECPLCQNHRLNLYPRLLKHYIHESATRNIMKSEWYCKECHQVFILNDENIPHYDATPYHTCIPYDTPVFALEYPKLAEEWSDKNILKADEIDEYYQNEVIWLCNECNGEWFSTISQRIFGKKKCPYCTNKYPTAGVDTLFDKHSEKMEEWSYRLNNTLNPSTLKENSDKFAFWDCKKCGLSYGEKINVRMKAQSSTCPHCKNLGIEKSETDLIYSEYVPNKSKEVYNYDFFLNPESQVRQEWKCKECDNIWYASAYDRFFCKEKCPYCSGIYAIPGKTSFKALYSDIEKEIYFEPSETPIDTDTILPSYNVTTVFKWKCNECGMIWKDSIYKRCIEYDKCPYCTGKYAIPGKTSFKALYPEIEKEMYFKPDEIPLNTDTVFPSYKKTILYDWMCCECGMLWKSSIYGRCIDKEKCPYCTGKYAIPDKTSLKALYPDIIENEWDLRSNCYICNPNEVLPNSAQRVWFHCSKCKHSNYLSIRNYVLNYRRGFSSCSYCNGFRRRKIRFF